MINVCVNDGIAFSIHLSAFQDDSRTTQDDFVKKTLLRRCLPHIKYLVAIMLIPPFLNYVALLQESAQLMPPGKHLHSSLYKILNLSLFSVGLYQIGVVGTIMSIAQYEYE